VALSEARLKRLKPKEKPYEVTDALGLGVRVNPRGRITFQYRFRLDGYAYRLDLGHYPVMSLSKARRAHQEAHELVENNINPIQAKREAERRARTFEGDAVTVEDLIDEFLEKEVRKKWKRQDEPTRILRRYVQPALGEVQIARVSRRDVVRMLEEIAERAKVMANRTASLTKQLFRFAVIRGHLEVDPCAGITRTSIGGPESPRSDYLSYREIWRLWYQLPDAPFGLPLKIAVKLLLLTGQRRGELLLARWEHFDFDRRTWIIPSELSKNGKPHVVHIAPLVRELLGELRKHTGGSPFLFPTRHSGEDRQIDPHAINRGIQRWRDQIGLPRLSPHVLRHTFTTHLNGLGIGLHIVEKILNHSLEGMLAVYNHQPYYAERVRALELWSATVARIASATSEDEAPNEPNALPVHSFALSDAGKAVRPNHVAQTRESVSQVTLKRGHASRRAKPSPPITDGASLGLLPDDGDFT
jgi:integrase